MCVCQMLSLILIVESNRYAEVTKTVSYHSPEMHNFGTLQATNRLQTGIYEPNDSPGHVIYDTALIPAGLTAVSASFKMV